MIAASLAIAIAQAAAPPPVPPVTRAPTSAWRLDRAPLCTIARDYDRPGEPMTIGWQRLPGLPTAIRMLVFYGASGGERAAPHYSPPARPNNVSVSINDQPVESGAGWYLTDNIREIVVPLLLTRSSIDPLLVAQPKPVAGKVPGKPSNGPPLTVAIDGYAPFTLRYDDFDAAFARLEACNAAAEADLGIGKDENAAIAEPAKPLTDPGGWITDLDYPAVARREDVQGRTWVLMRIATDGSVDDCRLVLTSGNDALDEATCRTLRKRARFAPAMDSRRQPVVSHKLQTVNWTLADY